MNKTVSAIILFTLGILLSVKVFSADIKLTETNHVLFYGPVTQEMATRVQLEFTVADYALPTPEILYFVINSPGGSLAAGAFLIDFMKSSSRSIKVICLECSSMGYNFFQAFGERIVYRSSSIMMHPSTIYNMSGEYPEQFKSRLSQVESLVNRFDNHNSKRLGISKTRYLKLIHDEVNLTGEDAVKYGHADRVATIDCDLMLIASAKQYLINIENKDQIVTVSGCPLIMAPLAMQDVPAPVVKKESKVKKTFRTLFWNK